MSPTIRIDEEVYSWLQNQARPFEDTPNSVLRPIAKFESAENADRSEKVRQSGNKDRRPGNTRPVQLTGRQLNDEWGVGARHALFHREGTWYNNLTKFPGALFDSNGYIVFDTEDDYRECPRLSVAKETNVRGSISSIQGYVRKT